MNDDDQISSRLSDLDSRLKTLQTAEEKDSANASRRGPINTSGVGLATRIVVEMVTTTLVGTAIGYGLDQWLGTKPWLMIVFLLLGGAAGVSNVYRVVKGLDDSVGLGRAIDRKKQNETNGKQ